MAHAHIPMVISKEDTGKPACEDEEDDCGPLIKYYKATELIPSKNHRLHHLFNKQSAAWASVQIICGILSIGLGLVFAVAFPIEEYFLTLFRVPIINGVMFLFAGLLSNLLYKYPGLLEMSFFSNIGILLMSGIGAVLLGVDLIYNKYNLQYQVEILLFAVTLLDMAIAIVLIIFINAEKRNQEKNNSSS